MGAWTVEGKGGVGKRWNGPPVGGTFDAGGGTDGSVYLGGGGSLKPEDWDPAKGPDDEKGTVGWGAAGEVGLKPDASDPTKGPDDEKGITFWGGAAAKGVEAGLAGKFGRPGFSVPMGF